MTCVGDPGGAGATTRTGFSSWSDGGASTHQITVGAQPISLTCYTGLEIFETATAGAGGTVSGGGAYYPITTNWTVTAVPNPGYMFTKWTFPGSSTYLTSNPLTLIANRSGPDNPVANFTPAYTVGTAVSPAGAGTVLGAGTFPTSSPTFTLTATTLGGYKFDHWSVTGANVVVPSGTSALAVNSLLFQPTQSFTATSSTITAVANYVPLLPLLNVSIGVRGTDVASGLRTVAFNATNSGNGTAYNARITGVHITALQTPLSGLTPCVILADAVVGPAAAALVAGASGGVCPASFPKPTVEPVASYIPASFGDIPVGGKYTAVIYFNWSTLVTKVTMDVTYTRDGGTPQTVSITTLR